MKPSRPRRARLVATGLGIAALALSTLDATTQGQPPAGPTGFAEPGSLKFREQQIASDFGVGYAVTAGDVNGDKKPDILAISGTDLVWFAAPDWNKTVILAAGATTADNVTIAPHDIDGDGRLDVALGAGWTRQNTGTLQWVKQNAPGTTPAWEVFPISAEPTLHRIKWADVDGDRKLELIVAPLHGKGTTTATGPAARLLVFRPPANPKTDPWPMELAGEANHLQHNFLPMNLDADPQEELVTASHEGLASWKRAKDGAWTRVVIGEGSPGEVKLGRVGGRRLLATVEPWHGAGVAVYAEKPGAPLWPKTTIETALTEGHALGWADFDGDGNDELAVGWRRGKPGLAIYSVDREGALKTKQLVDNGGMDTEDLIVGDFNGDGRPDIVASGRATRNIKIYWNETPSVKK
ncbi:MAG TPA: VCBS repeat-containing protein [Vicinamibacterales bacterium]|nr:VCBS repeat-containing protein [Vicinamibacterales bacterium]